jgi:flagellar protein FlaG
MHRNYFSLWQLRPTKHKLPPLKLLPAAARGQDACRTGLPLPPSSCFGILQAASACFAAASERHCFASGGNTARAMPAPEKIAVAAKAPSASQSPQTKPVLTDTELQKAVASLWQKAQTAAPKLQFSIDQDTGRSVIKVTDAATGEVIRQIPSEEVLSLDQALDRMQGVLFNKQA